MRLRDPVDNGPFRSALAVLGASVVVRQLVKFTLVGFLGLAVNLATLYALAAWIGLFAAGAAAFMTGASATWLANRAWTFRDRAQTAPSRQWAAYLCANLLGFALYYVTFAGCIALIPACRRLPVLPVGAGSAAGLLANFTLSRRLVFP